MIIHLQLIDIETSFHRIREPLVRYVTTDHGWFKHLHLEPALIIAKPCDRVGMITIPCTKVFELPVTLVFQPF